jgi:hypothetical protein
MEGAGAPSSSCMVEESHSFAGLLARRFFILLLEVVMLMDCSRISTWWSLFSFLMICCCVVVVNRAWDHQSTSHTPTILAHLEFRKLHSTIIRVVVPCDVDSQKDPTDQSNVRFIQDELRISVTTGPLIDNSYLVVYN